MRARYDESARERNRKERLAYLRRRFDYAGSGEIEEIVQFLRTRLARNDFPRVPIELVDMDTGLLE